MAVVDAVISSSFSFSYETIIWLEVVAILLLIEIFFLGSILFVGFTLFVGVTTSGTTESEDVNHPPSSLNSHLKILIHFFKKNLETIIIFRD